MVRQSTREIAAISLQLLHSMRISQKKMVIIAPPQKEGDGVGDDTKHDTYLKRILKLKCYTNTCYA